MSQMILKIYIREQLRNTVFKKWLILLLPYFFVSVSGFIGVVYNDELLSLLLAEIKWCTMDDITQWWWKANTEYDLFTVITEMWEANRKNDELFTLTQVTGK